MRQKRSLNILFSLFFLLILPGTTHGMLKVKQPHSNDHTLQQPPTTCTIPLPFGTNNYSNKDVQQDPGEKLFHAGMALFRASYKVSDSREVKKCNRDKAIDFLEESMNKHNNTKALAALYLIYFTHRFPDVKYPNNLYTLSPVQLKGIDQVHVFDSLFNEISFLAEISKKR